MVKNTNQIEAGSFRDPAGFVFREDGILYRQINIVYKSQYETLMSSGLYKLLIDESLLIPHEEPANIELPEGIFKIITPELVPFVSYPYEWSFWQYRDAALATLSIHRKALDFGMILKDASAYNVQFFRGQPILIDTLSFDFYQEGAPWVAYGQFCRHFLAPLFLMSMVDDRLSTLMRSFIDGIPVDLAARLIHGGGPSVLQHIKMHAKSVATHAEAGKEGKKISSIKVSKFSHIALIDSLIRIVKKMKYKDLQTEWGDYHSGISYVDRAAEHKRELVGSYLRQVSPTMVWDFGANDGTFSRIACELGAYTIAFDIDSKVVGKNYENAKKHNEQNILPLLFDLTNPSPDIGFALCERQSIRNRAKPDAVIMLAVVHHLAISNNVPLMDIARWLSSLTDNLIIEFVPKADHQVAVLLATRADIFTHYSEQGFEDAFSKFFKVMQKNQIASSERILYYMKKHC